MILHYSKDGMSVSDFEVESFIRQNLNTEVKVSTENVLFKLREEVVKDHISSDDIQIVFNKTIIRILPDGTYDKTPYGFCSFYEKCIDEILVEQLKRLQDKCMSKEE